MHMVGFDITSEDQTLQVCIFQWSPSYSIDERGVNTQHCTFNSKSGLDGEVSNCHHYTEHSRSASGGK